MVEKNIAQNNVISLSLKRKRKEQLLEEARDLFKLQAATISALSTKINSDYTKAVKTLLATTGRVVICGIGKSGLVGQKIAATFSSTGTPSFFMHPSEAFHGDLGMVTLNDSIIMISNSGETEEVVRLIPSIKKLGIPIIGFVGRLNSTLAKHSDMVIDVSVEKEACPNNLAPTNSTLATMAMGDALAVSLIKERNFQAQDFAKFHPGGSLGKKLLTTVADAMHSGDLPICPPNQSIHDALITITQGRLGLVLVMEDDKLLGIVTDGDLRRGLQKYDNLLNISIGEIMTSNPKTISATAMIADAEEKMRNNKIKALVVLDKKDKVCGIVEIFDD